ncbi:MAG: ABC transporter substrate-binding protein [Chitinophagaceae bacterium]
MTIGLLLPLSNTHLGMSRDFVDGFNSLLKLKEHTTTIIIKKESVGLGGIEKEVYDKAEKLLVSDDVDILIAYIDEKVTAMIYTLVQASGKLLIVVNPGANHPYNWIAQPSVIHLTLQHAFLCWLTGRLAGTNSADNKEAAYASSFYDCGYLHSADMVKNFTVSGGNVLYNYVNNQAYNENFEISQLNDFLTATPDCKNILAVYDEKPASLFYDRLNNYKSSFSSRLYVSPMMMTEKAFELMGAGYHFSIEGHLPWQPALDTTENKNFVNTCSRPASIFSLLGWESALIIDEIITNYSGDVQEGEAIVEHLKKSPMAGPRGQMKLDAETLYYTTGFGRFNMEAGTLYGAVERITDFEEDWKTFSSLDTEGAVTGWTNTYLCY